MTVKTPFVLLMGILVAIAVPLALNTATMSGKAQPTSKPAKVATTDKAAESQKLLSQADEYMAITEWKQAINALTTVLENYPDLTAAHFKLGVCLDRNLQPEEALSHFRHVAHDKHAAPELKHAAISKIEVAVLGDLPAPLAEDFREAAALLQLAAQLKSEHSDRADEYETSLKDAVARFERIQSEAPNNLANVLQLGLAYELQGRSGAATQTYGAYLQIYSTLEVPLMEQQLDIRNRKMILARPEPTPAGPKDPARAAQLWTEANRLEDCGELAKAASAYATILLGFPEHVDARYRLARCKRYLGAYGEAKAEYVQLARQTHVAEEVRLRACEEIESMALALLSKRETEELRTALSYITACESIRDMSYQYEEPVRVELKKEIVPKIEASLELLKGLEQRLAEDPSNRQLFYLCMGQAHQVRWEGARGAQPAHDWRGKAQSAFEQVLRLYGESNLPCETPRVREARSRLCRLEVTVKATVPSLPPSPTPTAPAASVNQLPFFRRIPLPPVE